MSGVVGIIPARAGFTVAELPDAAIVRDHPRSRGVYMLWRPSARSRTGSSPLTRGLQVRTTTMSHSARIIPARAGFTRPPRRSCDHAQDHPRSRGVYLTIVSTFAKADGSSPLARGLRVARRPPRRLGRIITARAGFTREPYPHPGECADHPRSRGVYPCRTADVNPRGGIIPARAGFTDDAIPPSAEGWDHPRSRGVYVALFPTCERLSGSSPLARGLQRRVTHGGRLVRIIPARAGFTARSTSTRSPRCGSSPLARGLPEGRRLPGPVAGIIPARAGFTSRSG